MNEIINRISALIYKYVNQELDPQESAELDAWINAEERNKQLFEDCISQEQTANSLKQLHAINENAAWKKLYDQLPDHHIRPIYPTFIRKITTHRWWAAAASFVLIAGSATGWYQYNRIHNRKPVINTYSKHYQHINIPPGKTGAVLTLADGSEIVLDSASGGLISQQNGAQVTLNKGQLTYTPAGKAQTEIAYNKMTTPRGRQFHIVLPDGSSVWLNAASSLYYPTAFAGNKREVILEGEGYFEIAANARQPFHVKIKNDIRSQPMDVEVLGTSFNIMAYQDEKVVQTTLLTGAVKIQNGENSARLNPGEQALVKPYENMVSVALADTEDAVAWKNGVFSYKRASVEKIMPDISRWYDVNVVYKGSIPDQYFDGYISKNNSLEKMLQILELNHIKFVVEGRTITVL